MIKDKKLMKIIQLINFKKKHTEKMKMNNK